MPPLPLPASHQALNYGGLDPNAIAASKPGGWGPSYQLQAQQPNCPTLTFQPASGVAGGMPLVLSNTTAPGQEPVGFCQSSQPLWSAYRDPRWGRGGRDGGGAGALEGRCDVCVGICAPLGLPNRNLNL